jgi:hypothetical protein
MSNSSHPACQFCKRRAVYTIKGAALGRDSLEISHCGFPEHERKAQEQIKATGRLILAREFLIRGKLTRKKAPARN